MGIAIFMEMLGRTIAFKLKHPPSKKPPLDPRYKIDMIHATSLDGNPLNTPVDRNMQIYLPPGYFESGDKRYPVIYFLHGYGGSDTCANIASVKDWYRGSVMFAMETMPKKLLNQMDPHRIFATYEQLDEAITAGKLPPFILVQVDGSLHVPQGSGGKEASGKPSTKGCFYVNSPHAGNFMDYVITDVIGHVDKTYKTLPDKQHRGIFGHSMGGYGTMYLCLHHPEMFCAAAALSSGITNMDAGTVNVLPMAPMAAMIAGNKLARNDARKLWSDMLDTADMLFFKDCNLPRDKKGIIVGLTDTAIEAWKQYNIISLLKRKPDAFKDVNLYLYCDANDEYGFGKTTGEVHEILQSADIDHAYELPADPAAALAPHAVGGVHHYETAIRHICQQFTS
jgi:pimeloyl-ACP methyl ester carboxylesterase